MSEPSTITLPFRTSDEQERAATFVANLNNYATFDATVENCNLLIRFRK